MSKEEQEVVVDKDNKEFTETHVDSEIEKSARQQGWVPKDDFRGDESDWIDADTFVQRGREINPILRKNNERIQRELDATKLQMAELKKATEEFKKFQKEAYERTLHSYEEELQDLKELKKKAVTDGNGDLVVEIDDKMDEVKAKKAASKPQKEETAPAVDPQIQKETEEWVSENQWYKTNHRMATATNAIADQIRRMNPYLVGKEFLDEVDKELAEMFSAEQLGKKVRPRTPVEGGRNEGTNKKGGKQSYEYLPPEAKAACDKFVKQKLMTREEYSAAYDWS